MKYKITVAFLNAETDMPSFEEPEPNTTDGMLDSSIKSYGSDDENMSEASDAPMSKLQ